MTLYNHKKINEILVSIPSNKTIYIAGHLIPDQDSVGSCMALAKFLNGIGKSAKVLLEKNDFNILDWYGDKSLLVSEITEKDYVFIALDVNEKKRLGIYENCFDCASMTLNIDHHQNNKYEANYTLSIPGTSSTCEIIYEVIKKSGKEHITTEIATLLYAGIMTDTVCFTRRLSKKTMTIAQTLVNLGIDYIRIIKKTYAERTMYEFQALAKLINNIKFDGIHYVIVDKELDCFCELSHNDIVKKIAEDLRKINTLDVFLLLIKEGNKITAKVMSNKSGNADKIAAEFGGGGHKKEAGFTVKDMTVDEIVLKTKEYLNI